MNASVMTPIAKALLDRHNMHMYQDEMVQFIKDNPFCALFVDLGLGKTVSTMTAMLDLIIEAIDGGDGIDNWLVVGPLRVVNTTWPDEIEEWAHTRAMTVCHIRDEVLTDAINAAGQAARELMKAFGVDHPDLVGTIRRHRELELRRRAKSIGFRGPDITRYGKKHIEEAMKAPLGTKERKLYVDIKRDQAAEAAVRRHKRDNPASIYLINREQVEFLVRAWGRDWPFDGVVLDESSAFKDHKTKRWAALRSVRPLLKRMIQLTATPATETYAHLFGQIGLLDRGERLGATYTDFINQYFVSSRYTRKVELRKGADAEIAKAISDICLTMKAEDYLPREEPVIEMRKVDMPEKAFSLYKQMENDGLVTMQGREIEAPTAAAMSQKLLQIASGVLYETYLLEDIDTEDMVKVKQIHEVHDAKIRDLKDLVDEYAEPILVGYHFKSSLDKLVKAFPKAVVMDKEGKAVGQWNKGKIPMLLLHPQAGAHGLNLQKGGRIIYFFDIPWSLELYLQFIGRLARQGQLRTVMVLHAIARGTLDEFVVECLVKKKDAQDGLFRLLKKIRQKLLTADSDEL